MSSAEELIAEWQPVVDLVGSELDGPGIRFSDVDVEAGGVRRYLEPLELDSPIHYDAEAARASGWPGIIAPYTSGWSYVFTPTWSPGLSPAFRSAGRDEQPLRGPMHEEHIPQAPPTSHMFGTNADYTYERPIVVGDRLGVSGRRLLRCVPKETRVGRGAFLTVARRLFTQDGELVCTAELEIYHYNPHPRPEPRLG